MRAEGGGQGLFAASVSVERDEFRADVASLQLDRDNSAIKNMSFAPYVPAQEKERHVAAMRRQGFPNYTLLPEGERNLPLIGFNIYVSSTRQGFKNQARDTGEITLSNSTRLVAEPGKNAETGFVMNLAVYENGATLDAVDDRRANFKGWLSIVFHMEHLMAGILGKSFSDLDIEIYDGDEMMAETLMFDSEPFTGKHRQSIQ